MTSLILCLFLSGAVPPLRNKHKINDVIITVPSRDQWFLIENKRRKYNYVGVGVYTQYIDPHDMRVHGPLPGGRKPLRHCTGSHPAVGTLALTNRTAVRCLWENRFMISWNPRKSQPVLFCSCWFSWFLQHYNIGDVITFTYTVTVTATCSVTVTATCTVTVSVICKYNRVAL